MKRKKRVNTLELEVQEELELEKSSSLYFRYFLSIIVIILIIGILFVAWTLYQQSINEIIIEMKITNQKAMKLFEM